MICRSLLIAVFASALARSPLQSQPPGSGQMIRTASASRLWNAAESVTTGLNQNRYPQSRWGRWRQALGPIVLRAIERRPDGAIIWAEGTVSHGWMGISLADSAGTFDPENAVVYSLGWAPPASLRPMQRKVDVAAAGPALKKYFDDLANRDLFSGAVIVARAGVPIIRAAYGWSNRTYRVANTPTTQFALGSVSKTFTAVAAAQLVESNALSWTDPIARWIPDYPSRNARTATLEQLLAHSAGLGRSTTDWISQRELMTLDELTRSTAVVEPDFAPGESARYSNEAFVVAGRIVELAGKQDFDSYLENMIFRKAGMSSTGFPTIDSPSPTRAVPYSNFQFLPNGTQSFAPGARKDATYMWGLRGTPAGGAYSTADDMLRFVRALTDGQLVSRATLGIMTKVHASDPFHRYGLGFELNEDGSYGKGGNAQGCSAELRVFPHGDIVVIILSNYDSSAQVAMRGVERLLGL